jgi:hypothetical protein
MLVGGIVTNVSDWVVSGLCLLWAALLLPILIVRALTNSYPSFLVGESGIRLQSFGRTVHIEWQRLHATRRNATKLDPTGLAISSPDLPWTYGLLKNSILKDRLFYVNAATPGFQELEADLSRRGCL